MKHISRLAILSKKPQQRWDLATFFVEAEVKQNGRRLPSRRRLTVSAGTLMTPLNNPGNILRKTSQKAIASPPPSHRPVNLRLRTIPTESVEHKTEQDFYISDIR